MPEAILIGFIFIVSLCLGSFLNVCIWRIPTSQSIVLPGSMCPSCKHPIKFYDNIPVISFLILRGRCRECGASISVRYPLVELATGGLALGAYFKFGISLEALIAFGFICTLLVAALIDIDHRIIPDIISLPAIPAGFIASFFLSSLSWTDSLLGILSGGGILLAVAWLYYRITGKEGMGGGDVKLLAAIGAFTGWQGVIFTVFVSSLAGSISGFILMARSGKTMKMAIPFGPFLSLGAVIYVFWGQELIRWYFRLF